VNEFLPQSRTKVHKEGEEPSRYFALWMDFFGGGMQILWQDLRFGARMLLKKPGFTLIAVLTLALGIGVNTALFTGFNFLLRPWLIKDPDTVVSLEYRGSIREIRFSYPDYVYFRDHAQVFSDLIAVFEEEKFLLGAKTTGFEPEEIEGNFVSDNFFSTLGGGALLGRFFTPEENRTPGRDAVVVLSHHFWQRRFAGDQKIVGRTFLLNGKPFTVIGVTSPDFVGLRMEAPDIWLPLMTRAEMATAHFEDIEAENRDWFGKRDFQWLSLYGRLKPSKTPDEAQAEMALLLSQLARINPEIDPKDSVRVGPISENTGAQWRTMAVVMGASGLVLLIACSNIANMLLARAAGRQKEIGVRLCLGASRWRVIRQLLTESFLLAALGGAAGVLFAWWSADLLIPVALARYDGRDIAKLALDLSPDARVMGFSLSLTLLSVIVFGLAPALRATRPDLITVIKDEGAAMSVRLSRSWLRSGLVVAQISLCLFLLIPAGLFLRDLKRVLGVHPGFEAKDVLVVSYSLELSGYDPPRAELFTRQLMERLAALPGVLSVSPPRAFAGRVTVTLPGENGTGDRIFDRALHQWVTANFLETIGTPLIQGRGFTLEEANAKAPVVIVSETTARNLWPNDNPLGKTLRMDRRLRDGSAEAIFPAAQVIGVARDNQIYRVGQIPPLFFYAPKTMTGGMDSTLLARTARDAAGMKELARKEAFALEPVLRLWVSTMEENFIGDSSINKARAASELSACLGALALSLASVGIYGVMAWSVAQRTREIGIRMALGAEVHDVLKLVLKQGMKLALFGIVIGVAASLAFTQVMKSMLFGLSATDPLTYALAVSLLAMVALLACYIPARRATKVNPIVALRHE
jgi:predicted permease